MTRLPTFDFAMTTAGYVLRGLAFVALYSVLSVGCALGWNGPVPSGTQVTFGRLALLVLFAAFLAAHLWLAGWLLARSSGIQQTVDEPVYFVRRLAALGAVAGFVATVWFALPALFLTQCKLGLKGAPRRE